MSKMIAYCGLLCRECPIYRAAREVDKVKKAEMISEIVRLCKTHYGVDYRDEDINACDGCSAESGRLYREIIPILP